MKHLLKYLPSRRASSPDHDDAKSVVVTSPAALPCPTSDVGKDTACESHSVHRDVSGLSRRDFLVGTGLTLLTLHVTGTGGLAQDDGAIKVGLMLPQSGPLVEEARSLVAGFDLCMKEKGIGEKKLKILKQDPGPEEQKIVECVTELVINKKVQFLVGPLTLEASQKAIHGVAGATTVMFVANSSLRLVAGELCQPNTFRVTANTYQSSQALAPWALKNVGTRLFITGDDETCCNEEADLFAFSFERAGGTFTDRVMLPAGKPKEIDGIIKALDQAKPDVVFASFRGENAITFLKAFRAASPQISAQVIGPDHLAPFPRGLSALGNTGGVIKTLTHLKNPEEFMSRIKSKLSRDVSNVTRAAEGYDMAAVICAAMANLKGGSSPFAETLQFIKKIELDGSRGRLRFDNNQESIQDGYVQEWNTADGSLKHSIVASLGESRSPDFGCGKIGFPGAPAKGSWQEPDLLDDTE